jgi:hypothetical protein
MHHQLFKVFGDNAVPYKWSDFKGQSGSFDEVWMEWFANAVKFRPDYATLPNQAAAELEDLEKNRSSRRSWQTWPNQQLSPQSYFDTL